MRPTVTDLRAVTTATGCLLTWTIANPAALHYQLLHVHDRPGSPPRTRTLPAAARQARISLPFVHPANPLMPDGGYLVEVRTVTRGDCAATVAPALPDT